MGGSMHEERIQKFVQYCAVNMVCTCMHNCVVVHLL